MDMNADDWSLTELLIDEDLMNRRESLTPWSTTMRLRPTSGESMSPR
jgi:hypothetical protein